MCVLVTHRTGLKVESLEIRELYVTCHVMHIIRLILTRKVGMWEI